MKYRISITLLFSVLSFTLLGQNHPAIPIYPKGNPVTDSVEIMHYTPTGGIDTKAAIIICPGGGYVMRSMRKEGREVAEWYAKRGTHAFVLKYRLGKFDGTGARHPDMLHDLQRAVRYVRFHAAELGVNPDMIGVMGFSAGGHLAAAVSTHFDAGEANATDQVERVSCLPNFAVLAYPVIIMNGPHTHWGSRRFLLGPTPDPKAVEDMSLEHQVKPITPPTFIFHTSDDKSVDVENSVLYYLALRKMGIPAEMHIFQHGPHGVGLAKEDPTLSEWTVLLETWLKNWGVVK